MNILLTILEMSLTINDTKIEVRKDGFINATQLCKIGGKAFKDWRKLLSARRMIDNLENKLKVPVIYVKKGNSQKFSQGSWIHPQPATALAQWISPMFQEKVCEWIEGWKLFNHTNTEKYFHELENLEPEPNSTHERTIRDELKASLGGDVEVRTPSGYVDLLTHDQLIEIKEAAQWKHAIGQVLSYGIFYPDKHKHIYLFGESDVDEEVIARVCEKYDITFTMI